jgi:alkylhydroperoxidase family enzyme
LCAWSSSHLKHLPAWCEMPSFSERALAALAWTEAVTRIAEGHVSDTVYRQARRHFSEKERMDLTLALVAINGWNRLATSFLMVAGTYRPKRH